MPVASAVAPVASAVAPAPAPPWAQNPLWASRAWHPGRHPNDHGASLYSLAATWSLALLCAASLWWLGLTRWPQGAALWLPALLPSAWLYLSARALRANLRRRPPRRCADPCPAQVLSVERVADAPTGSVRFAPLSPRPDGGWALAPDAPITTQADLPAWTLSRYEPGLWVAFTRDLDDPSAPPSLYPPPGGGRPIDAIADLFVTLMRRSSNTASASDGRVYWLTQRAPQPAAQDLTQPDLTQPDPAAPPLASPPPATPNQRP